LRVSSLPLVGDDTSDPDLGSIYQRVREANGSIGNLYRLLAHSPKLLGAWIDFAWTLRFDVESDRQLRELMIVRVAHLTQAEYEWNAHWKVALAVGVPEAKLRALQHWRDSEEFSPEERLALEMTEELTMTTDLAGETLGRVRSAFGDTQAVELVLTAAFYSCVSRVTKGLSVPLEPADPVVPALAPPSDAGG
jgi:4-carboxymuconolactone decarboxylase